MDPVTLKVLATLVQLSGTDATVVSDNKGIDDLLQPVREKLDGKATGMVEFVTYKKGAHHETYHTKTYGKWVNAQ